MRKLRFKKKVEESGFEPRTNQHQSQFFALLCSVLFWGYISVYLNITSIKAGCKDYTA